MGSLGELLKTTREQKNLTLREIADETRISLRYLEALETGRVRDLPGGMYNRAFLRSFAEHIGLDPRQALERYEAETAPQSEKSVRTKASRPVRHRESLRVHPLVIWSVMLLFSITGLYLSRHWISAAFSPYFTHRPALPEPSRTAAPLPVRAANNTAATAPPPAAANPPGALSEPAAPPSESAAAAQAPAGAPTWGLQPAPESNQALRIEFEVVDKCWVSVNSDGTRVLVRLLEPGARPTFGASDRIYIVLGNAGGVRLRINGKPARPLGMPGEVVKVLITTQNLADFLETPPG